MYASSKSGGNNLHGAVFYYLGSSRLRARSPFSLTVPFRDDDDYGASVGGPIIKNRTFFHSMYERFPMRMETVLNTSVPTMRMREGDFSALLPGRVIRDPLNGQPFADNVIPQNRLNPVSLKVQERFYPPPNSGTPGSYQSNFRDTLPSTWFKTQIETRIDHKLTNENSMFGRVMWNRGGWESQSEAVPTFPYTRGVRSTTVVTISDTHIFTPSLINEFRFGTLRIQYPYFNPLNGADLIREFGLEGLSPDVTIQTGAPRFNVTGFASLGAATMVSNDRERHVQFSDNVTWIRGVHTVKAGFDIRHNTRANFVGGGSFVQRAFGTFGFTGVYSNFPYADFLLGIPQTSNRTNPAEQMYHLSNTDVAGFIQDDWKVTRRLTLNIGLRWDFNPPYHERNGLSFHFDPTSGRVVVPSEESKRHVNPLFPANLAPIVTARDAGLPDNLFYSYKKHFMPRFGFAFRPFANSRTVIRGGYGMYTDQITDAAWNNIVGGPYISDETFTNAIVGGKPNFMFPLAFPDGFGATGVQNFTANDPHLRSPVIQQWNVTVERELFDMGVRVSYIGTNSRHLIWTANLNQPTPGMEPFRNDMRQFPAFRTVALRQNGGNHDYHSLHVVAERKMKNGLYYQFGWTWAKALTDVLSDGEPGSTPENSYARRMERANADYIPRHRTVTNLNYELPFGPGKPWLSAIRGVPKFILGGWSLTAMLMTDTGLYFNPVFSGYDVSNTNTIGGRPDRIADGNLPKAKRSVSMWFDPAAFRVPGDLDGDHRPDVTVGRFGNSSPNVLQGHGLFHLNAGLFKRFFISERVTAVLQGTFDNALNHPGWGIPSNNISVPGELGQIRSLRARGAAVHATVWSRFASSSDESALGVYSTGRGPWRSR